MLDVFLSVDTEVWCDGWNQLDKKFPKAFNQYIYGTTPKGDFGLPFQLKLLQEHSLKAVFFVEPLFATRFGISYLEEIVGLIKEANQEIQLHIHTEWIDEAREPLIENRSTKRQHLQYYTLEEQTQIIAKGIELLTMAGSNSIQAFRAGSFGANNDTFKALEANNIFIDSSYNSTYLDSTCAINSDIILQQATKLNNIIEYPISVFSDKPGHFRHAQLSACSSREITTMLESAFNNNWSSFVILLHNFELLTPCKQQADKIVIKRFKKLCRFLESHQKQFNCTGFNNIKMPSTQVQPQPLYSNQINTFFRITEQIVRKIY